MMSMSTKKGGNWFDFPPGELADGIYSRMDQQAKRGREREKEGEWEKLPRDLRPEQKEDTCGK